MPTRLGSKIADYISDEAVHDLEQEIALVDVAISELVSKLDTGESGGAWKKITRLYADYAKAIDDGKSDEAYKIWCAIGVVIVEGAEQMQIWQDIKDMADQKRKFVESNRKAVKDREEILDRRQQMALMGAIAAAVTKCFSDINERRAFTIELEAILNNNNGPQ